MKKTQKDAIMLLNLQYFLMDVPQSAQHECGLQIDLPGTLYLLVCVPQCTSGLPATGT